MPMKACGRSASVRRRTARRMRIPEGEKGHLSPERFEKQKESQGHPNAAELAQCQTEVKEFLKAL